MKVFYIRNIPDLHKREEFIYVLSRKENVDKVIDLFKGDLSTEEVLSLIRANKTQKCLVVVPVSNRLISIGAVTQKRMLNENVIALIVKDAENIPEEKVFIENADKVFEV